METRKAQLTIDFFPLDPKQHRFVLVDSEAVGCWHIVRRTVVNKALDGIVDYIYSRTSLTAYNIYNANGRVVRAYRTKAQVIMAAEGAAVIFDGIVPIGVNGYADFAAVMDMETKNKLYNHFLYGEGSLDA